jgi:phospholipase/lecithinase/hemolysin
MTSLAYSFRRFPRLAVAFAVCIASLLGVAAHAQTVPTFSQIIVFGDSLSDTGNIRHRINDATNGALSYPSGTYNYSDGRFTNSSDTDPASKLYTGVWHEQLAREFLNMQEASNSEDGGTNYAFGGATTKDGTTDRTVINNPTPFGGGELTVTIDNMGKQVSDYLAARAIDPSALYIVWGGGNDLFDDDSDSSVTATAARASMLVSRLASAGAKYILVENVPPLGTIPKYSGDTAKINSLDNAALKYRAELDSDLNATVSMLAAQSLTPTIYRHDAWRGTVEIYVNPAADGFVDVRNSSQGKSEVDPDQYLYWDDIHPTTAGHYQIAKGANKTLTTAPPVPGKALNLSTRASVAAGENVAIVGFIVTGDVSKNVVLRGLGPSLANRGVNGPLADPTLELRDAAGNVVASNDNWKDTQMAEIAATGIAPKSDLESAIVKTLAPGKYTAALAGKGGAAGVGLVEVYDNDNTASTLANLSTRGFVGTGENAMIGGLIIGSGDSPLVVVRALGPSLSSAGVANPLLDPTIELHDSNGALIASNDNWRDGQPQAARATTLNPTEDSEAVIAAILAPGNYTAVVQGAGGTTGIGLVEAYRIP